MSATGYVSPDRFTPESRVYWRPVGKIISWERADVRGIPTFRLRSESQNTVIVSIIDHDLVRVRFDPSSEHVFDEPRSPVVATEQMSWTRRVEAGVVGDSLEIDTGTVTVSVRLSHYKVSVLASGRLIHADTDEYNLVYIPGQHVIANFKVAPSDARYVGFGEKAGATLDKRRVPDWHFREGWVPGGDFGWMSGAAAANSPARMTFFNFDNYEYSEGSEAVSNIGEHPGPLNPNIPLYQSSPAWMEVVPRPQQDPAGLPYATSILFDNTSQSFVNFAAPHEYYFGALFGELDYYILAGPSPQMVLDQLTRLTGRGVLKPRWSLGFHQAGYGWNYRDQSGIEAIAAAYRAARIPIDGIHIDIDVLDNHRQFSVSLQRFPQIADLFRKLHDEGFRIGTNVTPTIGAGRGEDGTAGYPPLTSGLAGKVFVEDRRFEGSGNGSPLLAQMNYGLGTQPLVHIPDFGKEEIQQWWGSLYQHWVDLGLDIVWQDMTTPCLLGRLRSLPMDIMVWDNEETRYADQTMPERKVPFGRVRNLFAFNLCKSTFEGLVAQLPEKRPFIVARGGFIGEHRYAATWTGDNTSSWEFLLITLPQVLNMGLSGQAMAGSDVGGFGGGQCDGELLSRWTTMGSFLPWFRNHYGHYGDRKSYQEPFRTEYPEGVRLACKKYIELRYILLQVFYDAMFENSLSGAPIVRPMFWASDDRAVFEYHDWWYHDGAAGRSFHYNICRLNDQFFLGNDILVAPVVLPQWVTAGQPERPVYLPAGTRWYAFKGNRFPLEAAVKGEQQINYRAPWDDGAEPHLNQVPVYIREGAIVPSRELEQYVGERARNGQTNPITLTIYPGAGGGYTLYEDDGVSRLAEAQDEYRVTRIEHAAVASGRVVTVVRTHDRFRPAEPFKFIALLDLENPTRITVHANAAASDCTRINGATDDEAAGRLWNADRTSYYVNRSLRTTFIKLFDAAARIEVQIDHS